MPVCSKPNALAEEACGYKTAYWREINEVWRNTAFSVCSRLKHHLTLSFSMINCSATQLC